MVTQANPNKCECDSQLFVMVWKVESQNEYDDEELEKYNGRTVKEPVGFECRECGKIQLTQEVPEGHALNDTLDLPDSADRDMVRED